VTTLTTIQASASASAIASAPPPPLLAGVHHVAYRCVDAKQTVAFYRDVLGMDFQLAIAEDKVPSTGAPDPYMHVFLDAGGGNVLAFFELPKSPPMGRDEATPGWVQHIALKVADLASLTDAKARLEAYGFDVLGPIHHGIFKSIYFFDPNGHRLELACDIGTPDQMMMLRDVAEDMLEEWSRTKRAPRHAAWLHELHD
jgi:catechol 2,3-dioxygenase-like lactoylglutathione lyase family enzyme